MMCISPIQAWKPDIGGKLVFSERRDHSPLTINCGQCIECRLARSRDWACRCIHESQMHEFSSFVTLTYDDDHVPVDYSLRYVDFQLFMKRLRKHFDSERQRIRFFMCGEYGDDRGRPHFHACLFGAFFRDRVLFKRMDSGSSLYTSNLLGSLWPFGFSSVGDVTFESAAYVARYVMKKVFGDVADFNSVYKYVDCYGEVHYRMPEFCHMSLKPGIGATWFDKFGPEVFPADYVVIGGRKLKPPKYYMRRLEDSDFDLADYLQLVRSKKAEALAVDATPERLRARGIVTTAGLSFKRRTLE